MSKRELKKYIKTLKRSQLEEQVLDLYDRFKDVKVFYTFIFNPKEEELLDSAKIKISKEYFPTNTRKAKKRRSVAQKLIKHFITLGVDPAIIADMMLYNIEIAQRYSLDHPIYQESFYKSIFNSFQQAIEHIDINKLEGFKNRIDNIILFTETNHWTNYPAFSFKH